MTKLLFLFYNLYSFLICLRCFSLRQARKRPLLIHPCVKLRGLRKGCIVLDGERSKLVFGFEATQGQSNNQSLLYFGNNATLVLRGYVAMTKGTRLVIDKGQMDIGHHFFCNGDCYFRCTTHIRIGNDNMYGWNVCFNTSDGHQIYVEGQAKDMEGDIYIGNHVWIGSNSMIAKKTQIPSECVVAQNSLVLDTFNEEHCLIAGVPAKKIRDKFSWKA